MLNNKHSAELQQTAKLFEVLQRSKEQYVLEMGISLDRVMAVINCTAQKKAKR